MYFMKACGSAVGRVGTAVCLFGVKRPGYEVYQLPLSVAEVKESNGTLRSRTALPLKSVLLH